MSGEIRLVVDLPHLIRFADDRMPAVLSTPSLVEALEQAARVAIEPCLESHERSVGTWIEVEHLAPTPPGKEVICRARVVLVRDRSVTFRLSAEDEGGEVAKGLHKRSVIDVDRFRRRLEARKGRSGR